MSNEPKLHLGFIEMPDAFDGLEAWLEVRNSLLSVIRTDDVERLLKECEYWIAKKSCENSR